MTLAKPDISNSSGAKSKKVNSVADKAENFLVGDVPLTTIAQKFGTPAYVYDAGILKERVKLVQNALGSDVKILFALKANSNAMVAKTLRLAGTGAEVASAGEIAVAKAAGFDPEEIHFAGPGKTSLDLETAVAAKISCVNLESAGEADRLARIAQQTGRKQGVAIRVQSFGSLQGSRMRMSGSGSRFGVPATEVPALAQRLATDDAFEFRGLHTYGGTQCFDPEAWSASARGLVELADQIEDDHGIRVNHLNFGGGFGVPLFQGDAEFDIYSAGDALRAIIDTPRGHRRKHYVELGRFIAAPSGTYVARVTDVKVSDNTNHLVLDGGMHHHAAAAGMGSVIRRSYPMVVPDRPSEEPIVEYAISGPLCLPLDEFASSQKLPRLRVGDLLAITSSGAYGLSYSPVLFLGHPLPAEVLVDGDQVQLVRRRGRPEDVLSGQVVS
ncbi:alanine racemase [Ruegeria arenilitoris]|uniref:alanine racemase n=1 Tax=Ruegeria arenilitoris TaxID=1173585 RepID=UPI00147AB188|nr:alanine racemase [Ruegeria arenilitoris]